MDFNQIQVNWNSKFYFGLFKRIYEIIRTKLIIFFGVVIDSIIEITISICVTLKFNDEHVM